MDFLVTNGQGYSPLFLDRHYLSPLVRPANRADPVRLLGAVALRASVDRRARQAVMRPALVAAGRGMLSLWFGRAS